MTPQAISARTRIPLEHIKAGLAVLEKPDPESRSQEEDGRRIVRLDAHRSWGWQIVNHAYYRKLVSEIEKREADRFRIAEKRALEKANDFANVASVAKCREMSQVSQNVANVAHTDADTDADILKEDNLENSSIVGQARPNEAQEKFNFKKEAREVLAFLNEKTGKNFREVDANLDLIIARLKSGASVDDCRAIIAKKKRDWSSRPDMESYLRPETLFGKKKFESYIGELAKEASGG